jgi:hypothetical protein
VPSVKVSKQNKKRNFLFSLSPRWMSDITATTKIQQPRDQGCQIYIGATYQNGKNLPNDHKICKIDPMAIKYTNIIPTFSIARHSKIFGLKICDLATLRETRFHIK